MTRGRRRRHRKNDTYMRRNGQRKLREAWMMKEEGDIRDVRRQGERKKKCALTSKERETRDREQKERSIWMHRSRAFTVLWMGVAWLVGT